MQRIRPILTSLASSKFRASLQQLLPHFQVVQKQLSPDEVGPLAFCEVIPAISDQAEAFKLEELPVFINKLEAL